jgi:S-adenosylmethionine:tRNA ribosyltransferase-isomerase
LKTTDFQFRLPPSLVPDTPCELRGERRERARLCVIDRARGRVEHARFDRLGQYLRPGDVLVVNDSLVVHDQLKGATSRGPVALILFGHHADGWHAMVRPSTRARRGLVVRVGGEGRDAPLRAVLVRRTQNDLWLVRFEHEGDFHELLARHGERNTPPLRRLQKRMETYHNVYARVPGSLEIPSAGLHFTARLLERLEEAGVSVVPVTLHIGLSELYVFRHISARRVEDHRVPAEWYRVKRESARRINRARREGRRIVAVGTTVVRTLETVAREGRGGGARVEAGEGWTDLYIHPGHRYRLVDAMLTNLHQPRSSHLMLVAAFAGRELTLEAYREVVRARYRFDLFGDSMLIV